MTASPTSGATLGTSDGWTSVLPPLAIPAAYVDFGFAGNGDLLVEGTDDVTRNPAQLWIARYASDGTPKGRTVVAKKMPAMLGASYFDVDPTNDTALFNRVDFSTGFWHAYRVDSSTGKTLADLKLNSGMNFITAAPTGKLYGIAATYSTSNAIRPCIVDRLASNGQIAAGVDYNLKTCDQYGHFTTPFSVGEPQGIAMDTDGHLLVIDWSEKGTRLGNEPSGLGIAVLTTSFGFVRRFHLPGSWQLDDFWHGLPAQGWFLSGDHHGRVAILRSVASDDLKKALGYRVGVFDSAGKLLATYGLDGDHPGLNAPVAAHFDDLDRLWSIDLDPIAKAYVLKRLD